MQELLKILESFQIQITPDFTGKMQRNGAQWLVGVTITTTSGLLFRCVHFGDWSRDISEKWDEHRGEVAFEPKDLEEISKQLEHLKDEQAREKKKNHEEAALNADLYFNALTSTGTTPYLERKGIPLLGARVDHETLVVPLTDTEGKLWSLQNILPDGTKRFKKGGRIDGLFCVLQTSGDTNHPLLLAEGYATAASVALAYGTGATVLCAFNAGNLVKVAKEIRKKYPSRKIVICADNDQWKKENAGLTAATQAAHLCDGEVRYPVFAKEHHDKCPTDFNDLHTLQGLAVVKAQLETAVIEASYKQDGKPKKITDYQVNEIMKQQYGNRLLKYGERDFFYWNGKHYDHLVTGENDFLFQQVARILGKGAKTSEIHSAVTYFSKHCEKPPRSVDMLEQNFHKVNFQNGTLHALWMDGKYLLDFTHHNQYDYLTSILPFDFPYPYGAVDDSVLGPLGMGEGKFHEFITGVFGSENEAKIKIQAISELYGAALMPAYARIFFLIGPPSSGKSTVAKLMTLLIGEQNLSRVAPSDLSGFNLAATVGKRVNLDLDVSLRKHVEEDTLKKVVDQAKYRIQRKFLPDLLAPLPPIHVFCGNDMPKTIEGVTDTFDRRVIILRFGSKQLLGEAITWNYERIVWEADQAAVIRFAVRGLISLMKALGHFTIPESSRQEVKLWTKEHDLLEMFIEDLTKGQFDDQANRYVIDPHARLTRKALTEMWVKFSKDHNARVGRNALIKRLRQKGFEEIVVQGIWHFRGIGILAQESSLV